MSLEIIKFGFTAGELAPAFYGRPDLEKFDFGLARAYNWFVDYRGGLTSRPGLGFCEFLKNPEKPIMMFEFRFNTDIGNTYNMIFGHQYIRFVQDGAYITEAPKTPSAITKATPGVVTSAGHGYVNGDWLKLDGIGGMVELNGRTVIVANKTTDTFELTDHNGDPISTSDFATFTSGGNLRRVYTVVSPYDGDDVVALCVSQYRDRVTITHSGYAQRTLTRIAADNWVLALISIGTEVPRPTGLVITPGDSYSGGAIYAVTAVNLDGEESLQSNIALLTAGTNYDGVGNEYNVLTWAAQADVAYYNVYRSTYFVNGGTKTTRGADLGYLGKAYGTSFIDTNIIADFTKTPPIGNNPFAPLRIEHISVTADGSGYTNASVLNVTDANGSGVVTVLIVNDTGDVIGVRVINGGSGYTGPSAAATVGTGATFSITCSPAAGMWPALNAVHQQRQIYAASLNDPLTIWGSRPGYFDNFDVSAIVAENDSYEFELDSGDMTPIKHLMVVRGGLLAMTETGIWVVNGGTESAAITPTNVLADPHTFVGCADVRPIRIDTDLIYVEHKGYSVRELSYNDYSRLYSGTDISILSNHFFSKDQEIQSWAYISDPHKLIVAAKADGKFLTLSIVKDQKVYAWCEHGTKGLVERFVTVEENGRDQSYAIVQRFIGGKWVKYLEAFRTDLIIEAEDATTMDSFLTLGATYPAAALMASLDEEVVFTASAAVFSSGDVGKILRMAGGKAEVTAYSSTTSVEGRWIRPPTRFLPEADGVPLRALVGEWTLDTPVTTLRGLHHLEGETVQILVDGNREEDRMVSGGTIILDQPGTRVCIGLGFKSIARSLPLTITGEVIEGMRKRVPAVAVRLLNSRGFQCGIDLNNLYYLKERTDEPIGEPTKLQNGMRLLEIQPEWSEGGQLYFYRDDPTPVSLLGYVTSTEIGDDPN